MAVNVGAATCNGLGDLIFGADRGPPPAVAGGRGGQPYEARVVTALRTKGSRR